MESCSLIGVFELAQASRQLALFIRFEIPANLASGQRAHQRLAALIIISSPVMCAAADEARNSARSATFSGAGG